MDGIHSPDFWDFYKEKLIQDSVLTDFSRDKISLGGKWQYGIDQYDTCLRNRWWAEHEYDKDGRPLPLDYSFDTWETMHIPSCWNLENDRLFLYEGGMVFTRKFEYKKQNERVFVKFGGVNYQAAVFINKTCLGLHEGGSTPFYIEITDVLQEDNRIIVSVNNTRRRDYVPMDNTDWFNYGGIYRDVELIRVPQAFIRRFNVALMPGSDFGKIFARVETDGAGTGIATVKIAELGISEDITIRDGIGEAVIDFQSDKVTLWSPDTPKLYDVEVSFENDRLTDKVGFREITVSGRDIKLNGESIFLKGVSAHEESVKNGRAVTDDEIRENYTIAKEMGCNFMRLAHYPHTQQAARIADEMGIMLWEEVPVYWAIDFNNEMTYQNAQNQLTELITRDFNRASVILWSVGNENPDSDERLSFMSRLTDRAHALDSTRPVTAACLVDNEKLIINDRLADKIDIIGINEYYGWYDPDFSKLPKVLTNSNPTKPIIISEFGADCRAGHTKQGNRDDMFSEDFQLEVYEKQIEMLSSAEYVKGMSPWIFYDFRCPRRLHHMQNHYNIKGLLTADKKHRKKAFYIMKEFYNGQS
ncbi:MAG: glycoside hydrolase family 2 [Oscillospiraceae bacterium]|nr:glycoside hydrolase family 2 [Oscillospiraceae bacterium]